MYRKVLVALDGSVEDEGIFSLEGIFPIVDRQIAPDGEVILLTVIPPLDEQDFESADGDSQLIGEREDVMRWEAIARLHAITARYGKDAENWRCEVLTYESVADGIVDFAEDEDVDLIAMYVDNPNSIAGMIKEGVASRVKRRTPIEVKVFGPREPIGTL